MADRQYDLSKNEDRDEVRKILAESLKKRVDDYTAELLSLRKKEVVKSDLALPAAISKGESCVLCKQEGVLCKCLGKAELAKKSPPGKYHDLPEKLAEEGKSKSSAEAIAWAAHNKEEAKKGEKDPQGESSNGPVAGAGPAASNLAMAEKGAAVKKFASMDAGSKDAAGGSVPTPPPPPVAKGEDFIDPKNAADPKKRVKTVGKNLGTLPGDKKSKKIPAEGSGGQIKKGKALAKGAMGAAPAAPKAGATPPPTPKAAAKPAGGPPPIPAPAAKPKMGVGNPAPGAVKAPAGLKPVKLPGMTAPKESAKSLVAGLMGKAEAKPGKKLIVKKQTIAKMGMDPGSPQIGTGTISMQSPSVPGAAAPAMKGELEKAGFIPTKGPAKDPKTIEFQSLVKDPAPAKKPVLPGTAGLAAPGRRPEYGSMAPAKQRPAPDLFAQRSPQEHALMADVPPARGFGIPKDQLPGGMPTSVTEANPGPVHWSPKTAGARPGAMGKSEKLNLGACALCNKPEHSGMCG